MSRTTMLSIAFVLMLVALPLISFGSVGSEAWLWQLGFALLVLGLLVSPLLRLRKAVQDPRDEPDVGEEPS